MRRLPRSLGFDKQSALFSIEQEPPYLELLQTWGLARDRAIPRNVREEIFARQVGLAQAA
jgi:hypothetical protein